MKMLLVRTTFADDRTLGELYLESLGIFCDTLEPHCIDWLKEKKVYGKTAIPEGRYKVKLAWSQKRGRVVPWLEKVPHFTGIQIHPGNVPKHTKGCILVGEESSGLLLNSNSVFKSLMNQLKEDVDHEITIVSEKDKEKELQKLFPWYKPDNDDGEEEPSEDEDENIEPQEEEDYNDSGYLGEELEKFL